MKLKTYLMPYVARFLSSRVLLAYKRMGYKAIRKLSQKPKKLEVFLRIDDPYSYLLVQVLEDLLERFSLQAEFHVIGKFNEDMFPELKKWYVLRCQGC